MSVEIRYGDTTFWAEGALDEVCNAIRDGKPLIVRRSTCKCSDPDETIVFFSDPDWVSVEL